MHFCFLLWLVVSWSHPSTIQRMCLNKFLTPWHDAVQSINRKQNDQIFTIDLRSLQQWDQWKWALQTAKNCNCKYFRTPTSSNLFSFASDSTLFAVTQHETLVKGDWIDVLYSTINDKALKKGSEKIWNIVWKTEKREGNLIRSLLPIHRPTL